MSSSTSKETTGRTDDSSSSTAQDITIPSNIMIEDSTSASKDDGRKTTSKEDSAASNPMSMEGVGTEKSTLSTTGITITPTKKIIITMEEDQSKKIQEDIIKTTLPTEEKSKEELEKMKPSSHEEEKIKQMETPLKKSQPKSMSPKDITPSFTSNTKSISSSQEETSQRYFVTPSTTASSSSKQPTTASTSTLTPEMADVSYSTISTPYVTTGEKDTSFAQQSPPSSTSKSSSQNTPLSYHSTGQTNPITSTTPPYILPNIPNMFIPAPPYPQFYPYAPAPPVTLFSPSPNRTSSTNPQQQHPSPSSTQARKKRKVMPDLTKYYSEEEVTTRSEHEELDLRRLSHPELIAPDADSLLMLGPRSSGTAITEEEILEREKEEE